MATPRIQQIQYVTLTREDLITLAQQVLFSHGITPLFRDPLKKCEVNFKFMGNEGGLEVSFFIND